MDRLRDSYRSKGSEIEVNEQVSVISPLLHTVQWKGLLDLSGSRDEDGICHWGFRPVGFRCSFFLTWPGQVPSLASLQRSTGAPCSKTGWQIQAQGMLTTDTNQHNQ